MPNAVAAPNPSLVPTAITSGPAVAISRTGTKAALAGNSTHATSLDMDFASLLDASVSNAAQAIVPATVAPPALPTALAADVDANADRETTDGPATTDLSALLPMIAAHFAGDSAASAAPDKGRDTTTASTLAPPNMTAPTATARAGERSHSALELGAGAKDAATAAGAAPLAAASGKPASLAEKMATAADSTATTHGSETPTAAAPPEHATEKFLFPVPPSAHRAAADPTPVLQVDMPITASRWSEDLAHKVMWVASRSEGRAELVLTPPNMGRLEVSVAVNHDGQMSLTFVSPHQQVRDSLEQSLPRLREILADAGIALDQAGVHSDSAPRDGSLAQGRTSREDASSVTDTSPAAAAPIAQRQGIGLVDTFA